MPKETHDRRWPLPIPLVFEDAPTPLHSAAQSAGYNTAQEGFVSAVDPVIFQLALEIHQTAYRNENLPEVTLVFDPLLPTPEVV